MASSIFHESYDRVDNEVRIQKVQNGYLVIFRHGIYIARTLKQASNLLVKHMNDSE